MECRKIFYLNFPLSDRCLYIQMMNARINPDVNNPVTSSGYTFPPYVHLPLSTQQLNCISSPLEFPSYMGRLDLILHIHIRGISSNQSLSHLLPSATTSSVDTSSLGRTDIVTSFLLPRSFYQLAATSPSFILFPRATSEPSLLLHANRLQFI